MEIQQDKHVGSQEDHPFSATVIAVSLAFGGVALVIVLAELFVPIPGTGVVTDPREIFTTLGAGSYLKHTRIGKSRYNGQARLLGIVLLEVIQRASQLA